MRWVSPRERGPECRIGALRRIATAGAGSHPALLGRPDGSSPDCDVPHWQSGPQEWTDDFRPKMGIGAVATGSSELPSDPILRYAVPRRTGFKERPCFPQPFLSVSEIRRRGRRVVPVELVKCAKARHFRCNRYDSPLPAWKRRGKLEESFKNDDRWQRTKAPIFGSRAR